MKPLNDLLARLGDVLFGKPSFSPELSREEWERQKREQDWRKERIKREAEVWQRG